MHRPLQPPTAPTLGGLCRREAAIAIPWTLQAKKALGNTPSPSRQRSSARKARNLHPSIGAVLLNDFSYGRTLGSVAAGQRCSSTDGSIIPPSIWHSLFAYSERLNSGAADPGNHKQ